MSWEKQTLITLYCDGKKAEANSWIDGEPRYECGEAYGGVISTLKYVRQDARQVGWKYREGKDFCPRHARVV